MFVIGGDGAEWRRLDNNLVQNKFRQSRLRGAEAMTCPHLLLVLLSLGTLAAAQEKFIEPAEVSLNVEYYDYGDQRFGIYRSLVTWDEANRLCPTSLGSLVEFVDVPVAQFIARALAESAVGFGALWIGGRFTKNPVPGEDGKWRWENSTTIIAPPGGGIKFPMVASPFWVDRPDMKLQVDMCLGTDRRLHHLPLIVPVDCDQKRPFICKLPSSKTNGTSQEVKPPIDIGGKKFFVFRAEFTWDEAHKSCKDMGMALAKITTEEEFRIVGHRMLRARPVVENAWIGGIFHGDKWQWMSTDGGDINVNKAKNTSNELFGWYRPDNIINDGCLLADRHLCGHFVYVEAKCDRRRSYICELKGPQPKVDKLANIKDTDDSWFVSTFPETWNKSQAECKRCIKGGRGELLKLDNSVQFPQALQHLFAGMALTAGEEIRHIWLGGILYDDKFMWSKNPSVKPPESEELKKDEIDKKGNDGENGLLEYCAVDYKVDSFLNVYKCLNLDRENQKNFFMYGLTCDLKQHFICVGPPKSELEDNCLGIGNTGRGSSGGGSPRNLPGQPSDAEEGATSVEGAASKEGAEPVETTPAGENPQP